MGEYVVKCLGCGATQQPYMLRCREDDALLRAEYAIKQLTPRNLPGVWRFSDWLPVQGFLSDAGEKSITYRSGGLARELGLRNLYISFSGYWPERNARMETCSFKELEAAPTMRRLIERGDDAVLVVASAGNTARAFAHIASITGQPLVLVVPPTAMPRLWTTMTTTDSIYVVTVEGDYYDAIAFGERLAVQPGFESEGGARNIARRDGMGTVMLDAVLTMEKLPGHYFQAVGSGTGGIAAWEASLRLVQDGRFGKHLPRLHLAQNLPCAPLYFAWRSMSFEASCPDGMYDDVLYNRCPPYSMRGGVADALDSTNGCIYGITNQEAADAQKLFENAEEIDILPAPAVAVAALQQAVDSGTVLPDEVVLLNVTGGGISRLKEDRALNTFRCNIKAEPSDNVDDLANEVMEAVGRRHE